MKSRRFSLALAFTVVPVVILLCWLTSFSRGGAAAPAPPDGANFKGKFLIVDVESPKSQYSVVLSDARIRKLAERSFLVGKGVEKLRGENWCRKGTTIWISLEQISSIMEFENKETLEKVIQERGQAVPPAPTPQEQ